MKVNPVFLQHLHIRCSFSLSWSFGEFQFKPLPIILIVNNIILMKLIYIVEDHEVIRNGVVQYLELSGFDVKGYGTLEEARKAFTERTPDMLIQDIMLPDGDGFSFVKEVRSKNQRLPIIFLTARIDESDKIMGFELGCDDYITKPFSPKELVLRVEALFRRSDAQAPVSSSMSYALGESIMVIDEDEHKLTIDGEEVSLTAAEWRIVAYLASNSPNLISRGQILEECFDYSFESYERVVDTHIKNIRAKLKKEAWIETVRGYGYRFAGKKIDK